MKTAVQTTSRNKGKGQETRKNGLHRGQGLAEYAILISLVAVAVIAVAALLGPGIKKALCEPLIVMNPEFTASCVGEPETAASNDGEEAGGSIAALVIYSSARGNLYIAARPPKDSTASLTVDGYGPMQYLPNRNVFVLVIPTGDPPPTITIRSSDGSITTMDVVGR
jgi:hypothetical protein